MLSGASPGPSGGLVVFRHDHNALLTSAAGPVCAYLAAARAARAIALACLTGEAMRRLATEAQRATPAVAPVRYRTLITTHDAARLAGNVEVSPRCSTARRSCARDCRCRCAELGRASCRERVCQYV